jgi:AcrR family transcriptional regulator
MGKRVLQDGGVTTKARHAAEATVEALLDTAERMIADRGVDATSIRSINAAAGRNPAAVYFHFGTKETLVAAVLDRRMEIVGGRRAGLIAKMLDSSTPSTRDFVDTIVVPLHEVWRDEPWGGTYVRFLRALHGAGEPWRSMPRAAFEPHNAGIGDALITVLPDVSVGERALRLRVLGSTATMMLADLADFDASGEGGPIPPRAEAVEGLSVFLAGGLGAPASPTIARSDR